MDPASRTVVVGGQTVHLTKTECAILKLLMQNPKQVLAKSVILDRISLDTPDCTDSSLKQHISNLRKKLREADGREYIEAVWGIGFKLSTNNAQLRTLRSQRLRLGAGDLELKDAIAGISHDLRTPLTAICGYLDLLEQEPLAEPAARYLAQIQNRTEALKALTEELFRYSIAASSQPLVPVPLDLRGALEEALLSFYGAMEQRNITPKFSFRKAGWSDAWTPRPSVAFSATFWETPSIQQWRPHCLHGPGGNHCLYQRRSRSHHLHRRETL